MEAEYIFNITSIDDPRIKLIAGEAGKLIQVGSEHCLYQGGFMGNQFNFRIGIFKINYGEDLSVSYSNNVDTNNVVVARMGHLAFFDSYLEQVIMFGGQRSGDKYKQTGQRMIMNDVVIFDHKTMKV
jgi:hypothetical protein